MSVSGPPSDPMVPDRFRVVDASPETADTQAPALPIQFATGPPALVFSAGSL